MAAPNKSNGVRYSLVKHWDKFRTRRDLQVAGYDPAEFTRERLDELLAESGLPDIATLADYERAVANVSAEWREILGYLRPLLEDPNAGRPQQVP